MYVFDACDTFFQAKNSKKVDDVLYTSQKNTIVIWSVLEEFASKMRWLFYCVS